MENQTLDRLTALRGDLQLRGGVLQNEFKSGRGRFSQKLQVWTMDPGIIVIVQIWEDDDSWEIYVPATEKNNIPAAWEALDRLRKKVLTA